MEAMKKIIRVFPRVTSQTPKDENVRTGMPGFFEEADEVHISVAFTYDLPFAEELERQWRHVAPVKVGGPAIGMRGEEFTPGMYLTIGSVITSRGCNNKCWFCSVWKRDGEIRELEIKDGFNVMDDNLLACSDEHIKAVFAMLSRQKVKPRFTGGLEAKILKQWHVEELVKLKPAAMYFAYDTPDDYDPLVRAGRMLQDVGFKPTNNQMYCYALIGYPKDTMSDAENRMNQILKAGFLPFAMLWKDKNGSENRQWKIFQREWANPIITSFKMKKKSV